MLGSGPGLGPAGKVPRGPCSHSVPGGVQTRPVKGTRQMPKPQLDLKISQLPSNLGIDHSFIHSTKMLSPVLGLRDGSGSVLPFTNPSPWADTSGNKPRHSPECQESSCSLLHP